MCNLPMIRCAFITSQKVTELKVVFFSNFINVLESFYFNLKWLSKCARLLLFRIYDSIYGINNNAAACDGYLFRKYIDH